ncbi:hypothetical protein N7478_006146 [Penicillium angulare]|uniref:uncharacterized protein n=1 Tax=Penicillium angulare TaxID=116970 RepID=UPI00254129B3|nr:uncharacterized protein N7478_006146 [Penicillium angulare]KAJ5280774.1 hypothetical protein N7478_006146 [Penicillium angulare]
MLCGLSRLSPRSIIATALFFTSAVLTANFGKWFGGSGIPSCGLRPCYTPIYASGLELAFMSGAVALTSVTNHIIVPKFLTRSEESKTLYSYIAGLEFGLGLLISGMADNAKVLGFLAFLTDPYHFDPSLALVIAFGIGPSLLTYLSKKPGQINDKEKVETKPTLANQWRIPTATVADIDWRFVAGAIVFGVAWGFSGVCPGPALLRTMIQPTWGLPTASGYIVGNLF